MSILLQLTAVNLVSITTYDQRWSLVRNEVLYFSELLVWVLDWFASLLCMKLP